MGHESRAKRTITSREYIKDNFEPCARLAVVIKRRQKDEIVQRLATAERLAGPRFQAWLRFENAAHGGDVYLSMNPLKPDARGRTKQDIAMVRHVYLDLDHNGDHALAAILDDRRLPKPSYVLNTSLGKHQVIWKVAGFTAEKAEGLQRAMARAHGAVCGCLHPSGFPDRIRDHASSRNARCGFTATIATGSGPGQPV